MFSDLIFISFVSHSKLYPCLFLLMEICEEGKILVEVFLGDVHRCVCMYVYVYMHMHIYVCVHQPKRWALVLKSD